MTKTSSSADEKQLQQQKLQHYIDLVAKNRDKDAFGFLFDYFAPLVRAYSLAQEPGAALMADELAQIVLIKIWKKAHTYNSDKASVTTWVYTLARNSRIDLLRRNERYVTDIDPNYLWQETEDEITDPFLTVQQKRYETMIHDALNHLPQDQQMVLSKVYFEGKTHQESANELSLPLGTIKSRIRLALHKLKIMVRK